MRIHVKFFAILRDKTGTAEAAVEVPDGTSAGGAVEAVTQRYPAAREVLARVAVAVNREYASRETVLRDGDELALIPPVSGG
jgi:molybdopterin synthase catalytic subunit